MKIFRFLIIITAALAAPGLADKARPYTVKSEPREGIFIGLKDSFDSPEPTVDSTIVFYFNLTNGPPSRVYLPTNQEFFYEAELFDERGSRVPKKKSWLRLGSRFGRLQETNFPRIVNFDRDLKTRMHWVYPEGEGALYSELFRPAEIFEIKVPGKYTLRLKFQLFRLVSRSGTNFFELVRLPAVDYPV